MTNKFLCLLVPALALPACTLVGATAGGTLASQRDRVEDLERARRGEPEATDSSVMPGVMTGAAMGMLLDALAITFLIEQSDRQPLPLPPAGAGLL